jgi:hypothetical protein
MLLVGCVDGKVLAVWDGDGGPPSVCGAQCVRPWRCDEDRRVCYCLPGTCCTVRECVECTPGELRCDGGVSVECQEEHLFGGEGVCGAFCRWHPVDAGCGGP